MDHSSRKTVILTAIAIASIVAVILTTFESTNHNPMEEVEVSEPSAYVPARQGNLATHGGSPTVRVPHPRPTDDPTTTDDESNNQPLGDYGTISLKVKNLGSGNSYPLDADIETTDDGYQLHRLYFVKGGWIDFYTCDLDEDYTGTCFDENGRGWRIEGKY